ncbi:hypothetical protein [Paenibacillus sp. J31TS4]|uniref:hypothetical protein n=1 Tax=Paenibacillus sp. J31TS4 TaxID=2807195 RepID=UPI001BCDA09D|nr:hypothetical protein [Paenibacillus sp. J31TS4]
MKKTNHINYAASGQEVYCCLRNRVVRLDASHTTNYCLGCKMYNGNAGGKGVECLWEDMRDVSNPYRVSDPHAEWASNQKRSVVHLHEDGMMYLQTGPCQ